MSSTLWRSLPVCRSLAGPRRARILGAALALAALPLGCGAPVSDGAPGGGVVLITVDTLRADHLGVYGGSLPTPAMDSLAAEGALVETAYTPTPTTGPAHASLLTGLHPWRHGVNNNAVVLDDGLETLAERAGAAGIETGAVVSSYILHDRFGFGQGFESYRFEPGEPYLWRGRLRPGFWTRGGPTTDLALEWLDGVAGRPFLLWVHYFDPHTPYEPPAGFERPADEPLVLTGKRPPPGFSGMPMLADWIRRYRGEVAYLDAQIGRLLAGLRERPELGDVAIVLTSDHGEGLGDHGLMEHGRNLHEELVRVPLLVRAPGIEPGSRVAGVAQLEDLAPTVLSLLGLAPPPGLDGVDLGPWLRGETHQPPRAAVVGRRKDYKNLPVVYYQRQGAEKWVGDLGGRGRRFALDGDPREQAPEEGAGMPEGLAATLAAAASETGEDGRQVLDEESREALRALGYLE